MSGFQAAAVSGSVMILVIALLRSTPGMVHSNWTAFS